MPQLSGLSPARGLPGQTIELTGTGFANGAMIQFGDRMLPSKFEHGGRLAFTLPDFDFIGMTAGPKDITVVNPDGERSTSLSFQLETEIVVRVKAWRVFGLAGGGTGRSDDEIREIFEHPFSPTAIWGGHGIRLEVDPSIGVVKVSSAFADSWPESNTVESEIAKHQLIDIRPPGERFCVTGAINVYFVNDIANWETHAYAGRGSARLLDPPPVIICEDTGLLTVDDEAHVLAHEIGHVFGLRHTCAKGDEPSADTTSGSSCNESTDKDFLMYPRTNLWTSEGNALTPGELTLARSIARNLHRAAPTP